MKNIKQEGKIGRKYSDESERSGMKKRNYR